MAARSYLYVPGDHWEMIEKAPDRGSDAIIFDLEDSVAPTSKPQALENVSRWIAERAQPGSDLWVRVNPANVEREVAAVLEAGRVGIVLPKAEPDSLAHLDEVLGRSEVRLGIPDGIVPVAPLIETASGLVDLMRIASAPRIHHLGLGEVDLTADLGMRVSESDNELLPIRIHSVVVSRAAGIEAPVGSTSTNFKDLEDLRRTTEALRRLGFGGRSAIHPAQVEVINQVFTPSEEEIQQAREIVHRFDQAVERGEGVVADAAGEMLDEARVRSARETLALADEASAPE